MVGNKVVVACAFEAEACLLTWMHTILHKFRNSIVVARAFAGEDHPGSLGSLRAEVDSLLTLDRAEQMEGALPLFITYSAVELAGGGVRSAMVCLVMGKRKNELTSNLNSDWEAY